VTRAEVLTVPADLAQAEDIQNVVAATVQHFGGVEVRVDDSGGPALGRFSDLADDDWRQAFEASR
jgi:3-oxoacyl-[acyl-carrier protein] reductase